MLTRTMFFFLERIHVESGSWPIEEMLEAFDLYIQIQLKGQCRLQQLHHTYMGCNGGNLRSTSTSGSPGSFKPLGEHPPFSRENPEFSAQPEPSISTIDGRYFPLIKIFRMHPWISEVIFVLFVSPTYCRCDLFRMFLVKHDRFDSFLSGIDRTLHPS